MKRSYFVCRSLLLTQAFLFLSLQPVASIKGAMTASPIGAQVNPEVQVKVLDKYGKLPPIFEANSGQTDRRVKFISRFPGYTLFLTNDEVVLALYGNEHQAKFHGARHMPRSNTPEPETRGVLQLKLRNANHRVRVSGLDEVAGTSNYIIGNDPALWRSNVRHYAKVWYKNVYSGIDMVYHGNQGQLEYDFVVAPGADPTRIGFDIEGTEQLRLDDHGELVFKLGKRDIRWHKPIAYQKENGSPREIPARYEITDRNHVGFELAKYDASKRLYIDPLVYSTYLGGSADDGGAGIAVDSSGNAYVTGTTSSTDFPTTPGAFQTNGFCTFVTKFNPTGAALVYSTYLCGSAGGLGAGIAVDRSGNAYVTGHTSSTDFPTTPGAFQTACDVVSSGCSDAFVTEINPAGSALIYSTFLGGSGDDSGSSIALDSAGEAYVTGITSSAIAHVPDDFPTTPSAFQTTCTTNAFPCGFVTKLNSTGTALLYSTYLESATAKTITVDSSGNVYIRGNTFGGLPTTSGAFQTNFSGAEDAFVTKFNATGTALAYSTYLAGNIQTIGDGITVDSSGNAYITGATYAGFPTTPGAFQTTCNNPSVPECTATFVTKINPAGSALVYSTLLGGGGNDGGSSIAVDSSGNTYITGQATSTTFPTTSGAFQTTCSGGSGCSQYGDAFVTEVNPTGSGLIYSTYLGGSSGDAGSDLAVDNSHNVYVTGWTSSADFPTTPGVFQSASKGGADAFVTKIDLSMAGQDFSMAASGSSTATVSPGQIADYTIALTPAGGFAQPVALSCTGAPAQSTCSVPSSVSLDGSSPSEVKIAVTTAGETSANMALPASLPPSGRAVTWLMACGLPELVIFGTVGTQWRNRHRRLIYGLALLCLAALGTTWSACSSNTSPGGGGGTPQGSYKLTVTGKFTSSSTTLTHNTTLTLIVQ